jgi:very-short-patch-repair endonuclease
LVRRLSLAHKLTEYRIGNNETAILCLLKKYCIHKNYEWEYQFHLEDRVYDFRCNKFLIEFDEPYHIHNKKQRQIDLVKNEMAVRNGYVILRFGFQHDIIDIIKAIETPNEMVT